MKSYSTFFSVIVPCYNAADKVTRSIESLLVQTYLDFEVIVVLDGCTDNTLSVVSALQEKFRVRGISYTILENAVNAGPSKARNDGWRIAKGRYVAFLDSDDEFLPTKLDVCHRYLKELKFPLVFAHDAITQSPNSSNYKIRKYRFRDFLIRNRIYTPCLVMSNECLERFNEGMRYSEDYDFLLRLSFYNDVFFLNESLTRLGRAPASKGGSSDNYSKMRLGEMRAYLQLIRLSTGFVFLSPLLLGYSAFKYFRFTILRILNSEPF